MAKTNFIKPLLLVGGAIILITALKASQFINNIRVSFTNLSLGGSITNPKVLATLKIYNPTNVNVSVSDIKGQLMYKGQFIANVQMFETVNIKPFENVFFDLELMSTLPDMLSIVNQFVTGKISNDFSFDGIMKVNGVQFPYKGNLKW